MGLKLGFHFSFAGWRARERADFVFGGLILVVFLAIFLFAWEGFILYRESFQKRILSAPVISELLISSKDLDEVLQMIDERADKFNEILEGLPR